MKKEVYMQNIKASIKHIKCDLVIKNITIIDVFQNSSFVSDVAIHNGYIVGIGEYSGNTEIDGSKKYICPGLIDAHAHIESSLLTPQEYYKAVLVRGITSIIVDPHELANVLGTDGIEFMINSSRDIPFDFYFMLPSCVPATPFENSGATLNSEILHPFYSNDKILGLAEVMDLGSVLNLDEDMINKLYDAYLNKGIIDGHCAGFSIDHINAYTTAYVKTDHECHTYEELVERVRRGMYVHIREGTVAKNLKELIKGVSIHNSRKLCLCTDDKHIDDLMRYGSIDNSIRMCIKNGLSPETSIQMATLNTCECYGLKFKGAIAPGYVADFLILDSLQDFKISKVYKNGQLVVENGNLIEEPEVRTYTNLSTHMNFNDIKEEDLKISIKEKSKINIIEVIPNNLKTNHLKIDISSLNLKSQEEFNPKDCEDLLKLAVIERHKNTGNIGLGVLKGLKLKKGAIATTIAHDSHNLIVCGTNDHDMVIACNKLKEIGGGIIAVCDGEILSYIELEIGGLITNRKTEDVLKNLESLHNKVKEISYDTTFNQFLTLSFLSLPVIPDIKITDKGLFDTINFKFIDICE